MSKTKRKTFYHKDDEEKPIRAGGVLLYKYVDDSIELLLITNRGLYEDIGGCVDNEDKDIYDTVSREVEEETNEVITYDAIKDRLYDADCVYSKGSKYIIYIVEATDEEASHHSDIFGNIEIHDNIKRTISWIPLKTFLNKDVIKYKLNFRIKNSYLFNKLKNLPNSVRIV
jgi:hypothetical protein